MALIKCSECGKEVSDKAADCPNCGNPISYQGEQARPASEQLMECPKCHSTNLATNDKGFSLGKAAAGGILLGGVGLLAGVHGSKRIKVNCLNCAHSWVPFDENQKAAEEVKKEAKKAAVKKQYGFRHAIIGAVLVLVLMVIIGLIVSPQ